MTSSYFTVAHYAIGKCQWQAQFFFDREDVWSVRVAWAAARDAQLANPGDTRLTAWRMPRDGGPWSKGTESIWVDPNKRSHLRLVG